MMNAREVICKPFKKHHEEQLKLVSDFGWIDFAKLEDVPGMIVGVLSDKNARDYMDESRIHAIAELTRKRIEYLKQLAGSHERKQTIDLNDEVTENVAEDYYTEG